MNAAELLDVARRPADERSDNVGLDSIATWLVETVIEVAFMRSANIAWSVG